MLCCVKLVLTATRPLAFGCTSSTGIATGTAVLARHGSHKRQQLRRLQQMTAQMKHSEFIHGFEMPQTGKHPTSTAINAARRSQATM